MPEINRNNSGQESQSTAKDIQQLTEQSLRNKLRQQKQLAAALSGVKKEIKKTSKEFTIAGNELKPFLYPEKTKLNITPEELALKENILKHDQLMWDLEKAQIKASRIETSLVKLDEQILEFLDNGADENSIQNLIERREQLIERSVEGKEQQAFIESEALGLNQEITQQLDTENNENLGAEDNLIKEKLLDDKLENYTVLAEFLSFLTSEKEEIENSMAIVNSEIELIINENENQNIEIIQDALKAGKKNTVGNENFGETDNRIEETRILLNELLDQEVVSEELIAEIIKANNFDEVTEANKTNDASEFERDKSLSSEQDISQKPNMAQGIISENGPQSEDQNETQSLSDLALLSQIPSSKNTLEKLNRKTNNPALQSRPGRRQSL